jgi:hypothetical protein
MDSSETRGFGEAAQAVAAAPQPDRRPDGGCKARYAKGPAWTGTGRAGSEAACAEPGRSI